MGDPVYGNQKWEYRYMQHYHYDLMSDDNPDGQRPFADLNGFGEYGWELTGVTAMDGRYTFFFKKPYTTELPPAPSPIPAQPANNDQEDKNFASLINEMREESKLLLETLQKQIELQQKQMELQQKQTELLQKQTTKQIELQQKQIELLQKQTTNQPVPAPPANDKQDDKRVASVIEEIREVRTLLFQMQQKKAEPQLHPLVTKWHYQETRADYLEKQGNEGWEFVCFNPEGREGTVMLKRPAQLQSFVMERDYPFMI